MANCLVTKLKSNVNNPNLDPINKKVFELRSMSDIIVFGKISKANTGSFTISCENPNDTLVHISGSIQTDVGNSVSMTNDGRDAVYYLALSSSNSTGRVIVDNIYNVSWFGYGNIDVNTEWLNINSKFDFYKYANNTHTLYFQPTNTTDNPINLNMFNGSVNGFDEISANDCKKVNGNIRELISSSSAIKSTLRNLNVSNTDISISSMHEVLGDVPNIKNIFVKANGGSIEEFVAAQRAIPRTAEALCYINPGTSVTFNGVNLTDRTHTLTWTASTITLDGETITA